MTENVPLTIQYTGVRPGEYIVSAPNAKQNKGSRLQVLGFYPPELAAVYNMTDIDFRDRLRNIPFFASMTPEKRKEYLLANGSPKELYLEDVDLMVRAENLTGEYFTKNPPASGIDSYISRESFPIRELYEDLPETGTKARRHTLIFRPGNWMVEIPKPRPTSYNGWYFDLDSLQIKRGRVEQGKGYLFISPEGTLAVYHSGPARGEWTWEQLLPLIPGDKATAERYRALLKPHPPSVHKSLLQKCIRTKCRKVVWGEKFDAALAITVTFIHLFLQGPSFVPNINRTVSGLEAAAKRLAISIFEDSYTQDTMMIVSLMAASLVAKYDRAWAPPTVLVQRWLNLLLQVQQERMMFKYNMSQVPPAANYQPSNPYYFSNLLFQEIKGMHSDKKMILLIAAENGQPTPPINFISVLDEMPIVHCLDHHCYSEIALFIPSAATSESFEDVLNDVWDYSSAYNPRRADYANWAPDEKYYEIKQAQEQLWIKHSFKPQVVSRPVTGEYQFSYACHPSWISALLGPIQIKLSQQSVALVIINCTDILSYVAIRAMSREKKTDLSPEEKVDAITKFRQLLQNGIKLEHVPSGSVFSSLAGAILTRVGDQYYLTQGRKTVSWDQFRSMTFTFPTFPAERLSMIMALTTTGKFVMEYADQILEVYLGSPRPILQRILFYLEGSPSFLSTPKFSRAGEGLDFPMVKEDVSVQAFWAYLACLYPACLMSDPRGFQVTNGPMLWQLRDVIRARLDVPTMIQTRWPPIVLGNRKPYPYQAEIVEEMIERRKRRERGQIIWMPVGMGKTFCVMLYLKQLIERGEMPLYCLYTLPPSAVKSITMELKLVSVPYQILDMRKDSTTKTLKPNTINLIWHDHLRQGDLMEQVKEIGGQLLFIIDEFHLAMGDSIRTGLTLSIAKFAADFIALSGTIMVKNREELMKWLSLVVPFELTLKNYMVAMAAVHSRQIKTVVEVIEKSIEAPLLPGSPYYSYVPPTLGGTAREINFLAAVEESRKAMYQEIVRLAVEYLKAGEKIFICVKTKAQQQELRDMIMARYPCRIELISTENPLSLNPSTPNNIAVVITTMSHVTGYDMTDRRIAINPIVFSNQAGRDQRDGRMNRLNQTSPTITLITVHAGIMSYIAQRYEKVKSEGELLKGFAKEVGVNLADLTKYL